MARVYMSFIGMGHPEHGYALTPYSFSGKVSKATRFVQAAELQIIGAASFDKVLLLFTPESSRRFRKELESELQVMGVNRIISYDCITTSMDANAQWSWFERVLHLIDPGDRLTLDLTHGFRAISIVLSAALGFLQRAKRIDLEHVLYGNKEQNGEIVDMRDFYVINEWAEAVSRLSEDADARKMAALAQNDTSERFAVLKDGAIIDSLNKLTDTIRNVDVNGIAFRVKHALDHISAGMSDADASSRLLLELVADKFAVLLDDNPPEGQYNLQYFEVQLQIIELLLEHRLYMQAYTAMREMIGAIGMIGAPGKYQRNMLNSDGRGGRRTYGEPFIHMIQFPENKWTFSEDRIGTIQKLMPYYRQLEQCGIVAMLREMLIPMIKLRNHFDHAWVSASASDREKALASIPSEAAMYLNKLKTAVSALARNKML